MDNKKGATDDSEEYDDYFGFISDFKKSKTEETSSVSYGSIYQETDLSQGYSEKAQEPNEGRSLFSQSEDERNGMRGEEEESHINTTLEGSRSHTSTTLEESRSHMSTTLEESRSHTSSSSHEGSHNNLTSTWEGTNSFSVSSEGFLEVDYAFKASPMILWNKREYYYNLDQGTREKIWKVFERRIKTTQRPSVVDKDLNEDAFYSTYGITPSYDISFLKEDKYINRVLSCESLRILNMQFLHYNSLIVKETENYIHLYKTCNDPDNKIIYKAIVLQNKRIEFLLNKARNYLSEITLKGEEAFTFLEKIYYIVFKKSSRLDYLSRSKDVQVSSN